MALAHWIRNASTHVFRAISDLEAQRRWCLTGTPIQNGINDIFSLTRFLRFYPFDVRSNIRKFVTGPLSKRDQQGLDNLRLMMKVFSLRRVKTGLGIEPPEERKVMVSLSEQERRQYDEVKAQLLSRLVEMSRSNSSKTSHVVLEGIRYLRQICCSGLTQAVHEARIGNRPAVDFSPCDDCGAMIDSVAALHGAFHGQCGHSFCDSCYSTISDSVSTLTTARGCPICCEVQDVPADGKMQEDGLIFDGNQCDYPDRPLSSKLTTVMNSLAELDRTHPRSLEFPEKRLVISLLTCVASLDSPVGSLVFSYWKGTLNILESILNGRGMSYTRIDGGSSVEQRIKAIDRFQTDPTVKIMLLTLGTGSVGLVNHCFQDKPVSSSILIERSLNLTAASHVHLIEPHWNPMVEEQAAARVHRIGQNKPVTIWRYIVQDSIEEV
jgi:SWI/SNF-related matrix-associated actin-dependent regulator of chromatin subfamily A3